MKILKKEAPTINDFGKLDLTQNYYSRGDSKWDVPTLIEACKEQELEVFDLPLAGINLYDSFDPKVTDAKSLIWQTTRIQNADLKYPIILDDYGFICDGWHRVCKAIMENKRYIKAYRLKYMPRISGEEKD